MATLKKMTRVGADVRQIARLLQAKAPEGHMLAYITPEEAQILKSQGGSGKPHANTGIPSFEVFSEYDTSLMNMPSEINADAISPEPVQARTDYPSVTNVDISAPVGQSEASQGKVSGPTGVNLYGSSTQLPTYSSQSTFPNAVSTAPYEGDMSQFTGAFPVGTLDRAPGSSGPAYQIDTTPAKGVMERLTEATGMSKETLARLGLAGGLGAYGAYQGKKARQQAEEAKKEQQKLAAPYRQQGAELQRAAQAGELTPQSAQALQAVQAQVAQQASARGGVGTMQSQAQVEAFRQQLLASQYDYGLKLSGIGDNIALGAIKTGLEADRYVQNLSNSFYTNMANIAGGMPAQAQAQQRTA